MGDQPPNAHLRPEAAALTSSTSGNPSPASRQALPPLLEPSEAEGTRAAPSTTSPVDALRRNSLILTDSLLSLATSASDYFSQDALPTHTQPRPQTTEERQQSTTDTEQYVSSARERLYRGSEDSLGSSKSRDHDIVRPKPQRSNTELPRFPNQAFSALHFTQNWHGTHAVSPHTRNLSSQSQPTDASVSSDKTRSQPDNHHITKTAGNTPIQTPYLSSTTPPLRSLNIDRTQEGPALSPYLRPVQGPPARITTNAQRDYDYISGNKMINRYELMSELGRGVHGKVKLAKNLDVGGEPVAIKIVQRFSKRRRLGRGNVPEDKVKKEIAILKKVQHPNVVRLIEVIDDPDVAKVYIVLEYCEQRELVWRTPGEADIVLMEYIDQSQACGQLSSDAADEAVGTVQRMTRRRRARQDRQRMQAIREGQDADDVHNWSLTYAADSDEDLVSLATEPERPLEDSEDHGFSFYSTEWYQDEGSKFRRSPPPADTPRQRQVSVAESNNSGLQEYMQDEVPRDFKFVPTLTLDECRSAFRDAVVGLDYLHYHGIIHRDIKPENLLRTKGGMVKISDFGVSFLGKPIRSDDESGNVSETDSTDLEQEKDFAKTVGTPAFYAPELCSLDVDVEARMIKSQVDIWALGITLYCMVFARTPFDAENEFALMKRTREEEIYVPRRRLMAVDPSSRTRAPGHHPLYQPHKRNKLDRVHESIDDDLNDLMKKLFQKDPSKRITINEIKHHPWTIRDIPDPATWLDETDPSRVRQGEKIQVSTEEVEKAVAPFDRFKSFGKRALSVLGIGGRRRGHSSTASSEAGSAASLADHTGQERRSMAVQQSAVLAPAPQKPPREQQIEHPLSRSVTASPDPQEQLERVYSDPNSLSPLSTPKERVMVDLLPPSPRPTMPDRQASEMSTAASIRTIRPSDFERGRRPSTSPADIPELDELVTTRPASTIGSIFRGAGDSIFRAMRSKDRFGSASSSPRRSSTILSEPDRHGEATAAVSNTSAPGHVDFPQHLQERLSAISTTSDASQQRQPVSVSERSESPGPVPIPRSRKSSLAALSSLHTPSRTSSPLARSPMRIASPIETSPVQQSFTLVEADTPSQSAIDLTKQSDEAFEDEYRRARFDLARRQSLQDKLNLEHAQSSRAPSATDQRPCPPSPDDDQPIDYSRVLGSSQATARDYIPRSTRPSMTSSDDPTSEMTRSRSTSFPSVPSATSGFSSISSGVPLGEPAKLGSAESSEGTLDTYTPIAHVPSISGSDDGYQGDGDGNGEDVSAIASDTDSESDEEFLTMSKKKKQDRADSVSVAQLAKLHQAYGEGKTSRSGSTNTMRKVRSLSSHGTDPENATSPLS